MEMVKTETGEFTELNGFSVADRKARDAINELGSAVNGLGLAVMFDEPTERLDLMMNGSQTLPSYAGETTETDKYDAESESLTIY